MHRLSSDQICQNPRSSLLGRIEATRADARRGCRTRPRSWRMAPPPSFVWEAVCDPAAFAPRDGAGALSFAGRMWLLGGWNPERQWKQHFPRICNSEVNFSSPPSPHAGWLPQRKRCQTCLYCSLVRLPNFIARCGLRRMVWSGGWKYIRRRGKGGTALAMSYTMARCGSLVATSIRATTRYWLHPSLCFLWYLHAYCTHGVCVP